MMKSNYHYRLVALLATLWLSAIAPAATWQVALPDVAQCLKNAKAGDCIQVTDGIYADVALKWQSPLPVSASEQQPVVVEALHPGKVVITGKSSLQLAGDYLTVRGLRFKDGQPLRKSVVDFAIGSRVANHCRLTDCAIENFNAPRRDVISSYIILSGRYNRVDHCSLLGKRNLGVTLLVNLNGENCLQNHHQIDHNYFGKREVYGSNGAETMRIGTSQQAYLSSNTLVEDNLFEQCNGEVEVISVKSSDNIVRRNILLECEGVVALRHGKRNLVEGNWFIGNDVRNTGGVRIVDSDHRVTDNTFFHLAGERFFSALGVMNAVPNSLPNRYVLVKDVVISGNTFVGCKSLEMGTGKDPERAEPPVGVTFADNDIINPQLTDPFIMLDAQTQLLCKDNRLQLAAPCQMEGFKTTKLKAPKLPSDQEMRQGRGVSWNDDCGMTSVGRDSVMVLTEPEYRLTQTIVIDRPVILKGTGQTVLRYVGDQPAPLITIADGGSLTVSGIVFDGTLEPGKKLATAGISTADNMNSTYRLKVDGCEFRNFVESGFAAIKGTKATFADSVVIRNSLFRDISGNGIDFSAEKDDKGRYNADDIIIENCTFRRFLGIPVNIYRGGSDESTAGPYITVANCTFDDCCNRQRGSALRLIGPQLLEVTDCRFIGSGRGGASIRLDEAIWERIAIHDCSFTNSGKVMTSTDTVSMYDNTYN